MHGGWNSDDNQNHNLGRFRLSVTAAEDHAGPTGHFYLPHVFSSTSSYASHALGARRRGPFDQISISRPISTTRSQGNSR